METDARSPTQNTIKIKLNCIKRTPIFLDLLCKWIMKLCKWSPIRVLQNGELLSCHNSYVCSARRKRAFKQRIINLCGTKLLPEYRTSDIH